MSTNDPLGGLENVLGGLTGGGGAAGASGLPAGLGEAIGGLLGGAGGTGGTAGLEGLVQSFEKAGLGEQVASWVGTGANKPVGPDEISQALGPDKVQELSKSTGLDVGQLLPMLAMFLPQIINALTPKGQLPKAGEPTADPAEAIGGLLKGLGV